MIISLRKGDYFAKMADNILKRLTTKIIYRVDVNFHMETSDLDTFIGRKAHIEFLDNNIV